MWQRRAQPHASRGRPRLAWGAGVSRVPRARSRSAPLPPTRSLPLPSARVRAVDGALPACQPAPWDRTSLTNRLVASLCELAFREPRQRRAPRPGISHARPGSCPPRARAASCERARCSILSASSLRGSREGGGIAAVAGQLEKARAQSCQQPPPWLAGAGRESGAGGVGLVCKACSCELARANCNKLTRPRNWTRSCPAGPVRQWPQQARWQQARPEQSAAQHLRRPQCADHCAAPCSGMRSLPAAPCA